MKKPKDVGIARIGGVTSQIIEMISKMCSTESEIDCSKIPYSIYGVMTLIGCILMFGLPETKNESSPDNIEQGNKFGKVFQKYDISKIGYFKNMVF